MKPSATPGNTAWRKRFEIPRARAQLADTNPARGLVVSDTSGIYQLYAWQVDDNQLQQVTDSSTGVAHGFISPDGRWIYYLDDTAGDEVGHYVRVPFEGGAAQDITPDFPRYSSWSLTFSRHADVLGLQTVGATGFSLHVAQLRPDGLPEGFRCIFRSAALTPALALSADGKVAVAMSTEGMSGVDFKLLAFNLATGDQISELTDGPGTSIALRMPSPVAGDARVLGQSSRTGEHRPVLWNAVTGAREDLQLGELHGGVYPCGWSPDGETLLLVNVNQACQQLFRYQLDDGSLHALKHPPGTFGAMHFTPGGEILAHWEDAVHPPQLIALDAASGQRTRTVMPVQDAPAGRPWQSISFASTDGTPIQGWLCLPEGDGPFPTILETHGGPAAVTHETFDAAAQAWVDHGFAFCTINYRGSLTFGREFEKAIWGDLGNKEVEDMAAARGYLVANGIAHASRVLLTGRSYGGYLTLQALGKKPELWAGGMATVAIADWAMQYEDSADAYKGYQVALLGGTPEEKAEQYRVSSPITYAEHVQAPVLIFQGRNDTRCPARPMQVYEQRMKQLGKDIEVHWFDAGHGCLAKAQAVEQQQRMLDWAQRVVAAAERVNSRRGDA